MDTLSPLAGAPIDIASIYEVRVDIIILAAKTISKKRQPEVGSVRSNRHLACKWKFQMAS